MTGGVFLEASNRYREMSTDNNDIHFMSGWSPPSLYGDGSIGVWDNKVHTTISLLCSMGISFLLVNEAISFFERVFGLLAYSRRPT